jgi:uncharacterized membrane protein YccC
LTLIFAAKTTASALIALLVAFTFNLDQPQWALLTVFIVSQPQSGLVLAKSFYRLIGTLVGAAVALLLVGLFARERVLFLGSLALWIGLCSFGSQYARNFAAYSFVLSGYTVAIVGIPSALDAGNAFYTATARVTEISLGIIVSATISRIVLPDRLAVSLWKAVADTRVRLAEYAAAVIDGGDITSLRAKVISQAIASENMRSSAVFEDREVRARSNSLRLLNAALINVIAAAQPLGTRLDIVQRNGDRGEAAIDDARAAATAAITGWRSGTILAAELHRALLKAGARPPLSGLRAFFAALVAYAKAYDDCFAADPKRPPGRIGFGRSNDALGALWIGIRAAVAVFVGSSFWILSAWPHGSTAVILGAVATARLATMGQAVPIALAGTLIFGFSAAPAFVIVEVLLPLASGFAMFSLIVAPMIFCCALLMANKNPKLQLVGYLSGLLFASVGQFQNRMVYDPVAMINTSIAAVFAAGLATLLWSILAPQTPEAARARFLRVARRALARIAAPGGRLGLVEFETAITEALDRLQGRLRPGCPDDIAAFEKGVALLGAGRGLAATNDAGRAAQSLRRQCTALLAEQQRQGLHDAA